jgi:hypothetical protein
LRRKLNELVHSGDFYESKEQNSFLNLDNEFDTEAQDVLNEAVDYIINKKDLSSKIKKRVLQGIAPVTVTASSMTQRTNPDKTSTKRMRTQTPTKTNRTNTVTIKSLNSRNKSKSRNMTRRRSKSMF